MIIKLFYHKFTKISLENAMQTERTEMSSMKTIKQKETLFSEKTFQRRDNY